MSSESATPVVVAKEVHKAYGSGELQVHVLKGVSLSVNRGEMVAIMGPSGGGKTTLLNCLSGLDDIDSGLITIGGSDLSRMKDAEKTRFRATKMGYVFQAFNLLPVLSALENVEMPLLVSGFDEKESRTKAIEAGFGRALRARQPLPFRAFRWATAAGDHCPCAREPAGNRMGGRTDGQP